MTPWLRQLPYLCLQALLWCSVLAGASVLAPGARAQSLESVLSPGKLIQGHAKLEDECSNCHVRFNRQAQDGQCTACHKDIGADMRAKTGFHGRQKPLACNSCHTDHRGRTAQIVKLDPRNFDHSQTDFVLRGKHPQAACEKCHASGKKFSEAPHDCSSCHKKDDVHKGGLGVKCADCHTESNWKDYKFDHEKTRFSLTGKHAQAKCVDCHQKNQYKDTVRTCVGCHKKNDDSAKGHKGQFGEKCESCHGVNAWKPSNFNHDTDTKYDLRGKHRTASCTDCHKGHLYRIKLAQECIACHQKDDKHQGTLGKDCASCHSERSWKEPAKFNHNQTNFPLLGKHVQADCRDCHKSTVFNQAPKDCIGCHKKDDKHEATLGQECKSCHSERDWKNTSGRFDHSKTKFALRNAHAEGALKCNACHKDLKSFRNTATDCFACHKKDDKHEATLGQECKSCHSDINWKASAGLFDHNKTKFALRNAHAEGVLKCSACHKDSKSFRNTATDCYACHKKDDKHEGQQGQKCDQCHNDRKWKDTRFDHNQTRFALIGKHITVKCADCHKSNRFKDAPSDCYGCHKNDDKHKQVFGVKCDICHNTRGWAIWDFDHNRRTEYKLDGAHVKLACESCHKAAAPAGKNAAAVGKTCISCHRNNDAHDGQFGLRCEQCHTTDNWKRTRSRLGAHNEGVLQRVLALMPPWGYSVDAAHAVQMRPMR